MVLSGEYFKIFCTHWKGRKEFVACAGLGVLNPHNPSILFMHLTCDNCRIQVLFILKMLKFFSKLRYFFSGGQSF